MNIRSVARNRKFRENEDEVEISGVELSKRLRTQY